MIIVDVELPSGYAMESWRDTNEVRELSKLLASNNLLLSL